jgi:tetratricopeptide (TPR) repeat protein
MRLTRVAVTLLVWLGSARADDKEVARQAYREGTRQYELGDFKAALDAFKKAYLNYEDPAILFNLAQCQRQLGDKVEALRTYRVFLHKVPETTERAQIEKIIAELQAAIDHDKAAKAQPPTETVEPSIARTPTEPPPTAQSPTNSTAQTTVTEAPAKKPLVKRGWFWGVVVGGVVVVAGAVTLGILYGRPQQKYLEYTY